MCVCRGVGGGDFKYVSIDVTHGNIAVMSNLPRESIETRQSLDWRQAFYYLFAFEAIPWRDNLVLKLE